MSIFPLQKDVSISMQVMSQRGHSNHYGGESKRINLTQARKILGVSPNKMSKLVTDGSLRYELDPLDQRVKLVFLEDVERLKQLSQKS